VEGSQPDGWSLEKAYVSCRFLQPVAPRETPLGKYYEAHREYFSA
jgi:hypothetical protein